MSGLNPAGKNTESSTIHDHFIVPLEQEAEDRDAEDNVSFLLLLLLLLFQRTKKYKILKNRTNIKLHKYTHMCV